MNAEVQTSCRGWNVFNPWITEQLNFQLLQYWVHFMATFFYLFSQLSFQSLFLRLKAKKKKSPMQICHFSFNYYRMKCLKYLGTNKYSLEQKCEWNYVCEDCSWQLLLVTWIVVIEWSLYTCFEHWQHFQSVALSLTVGKTELTRVWNGPVRFEKNVVYEIKYILST